MTTRTGADPRPLTGEPVSLDLLNTRWIEDGEPVDLFASAAGLTRVRGLAVWLESAGLAERFRADAATLVHVLTAREALARFVADPADAGARALIDAVLEHGRIRITFTAEGAGERAEFTDPTWGPAWTAVRGHVELSGTAADRIRVCASPTCGLRFLDDSRDGTRRWCSTACGDLGEGPRHNARTRER